MVTCGTLMVVDTFDPGAVTLTGCAIPDAVTEGNEWTASITVRNDNTNAATVSYDFYADGVDFHFAVGTVQGNSTETLQTNPGTFLAPGDHEISVEITNVREVDSGALQSRSPRPGVVGSRVESTGCGCQ